MNPRLLHWQADSLPLRSPCRGIGPSNLPSGGRKQSWKEGQPLCCFVGKHSWDASGSSFTPRHLLCNPLTVAAEGGKAAGVGRALPQRLPATLPAVLPLPAQTRPLPACGRRRAEPDTRAPGPLHARRCSRCGDRASCVHKERSIQKQPCRHFRRTPISMSGTDARGCVWRYV